MINANGLRGSRAAAVFTFVILPALLGGCRQSGRLQEVSGQVSLGGEPLEQGSIQFVRVAEPAEPAGGAMIRNGSYSLPRAHGLDAGRYQVLITSPELPSAPDGDAMRSQKAPNRERIPAAFNTESTQFVEVRSGGMNQFDFAIEP